MEANKKITGMFSFSSPEEVKKAKETRMNETSDSVWHWMTSMFCGQELNNQFGFWTTFTAEVTTLLEMLGG